MRTRRGEPTLLATMSTVDPIKIAVTVSEVEYLRLARRESERRTGQGAPLELVLADGTRYPLEGRTTTLDRNVDPKTGTIVVEALFPNPEGLLRPGQFGRVRAVVEERPDAILVPQLALQEIQGAKSVLQLDYNPCPPENANPDTPWPLWPKILRITPAHEEGGRRDWQIKTKNFAGDDRGRVTELHAVRIHQYFDKEGERQFEELHGSEIVFPCDLVLLDSTISRQHAELVADEFGVLVRDLESSNGTLLNGDAIDEARAGDGDTVTFGGAAFTLREQQSAQPYNA